MESAIISVVPIVSKFLSTTGTIGTKKKSAKRSFPFNTNHTERTHRNFNVFMLWNDSFVKFVSLFLERTLKHKINNRNLRHKLEGPKLLLIISISAD